MKRLMVLLLACFFVVSGCESQGKKVKSITLQQARARLGNLKSQLNVKKDEFETTEDFEARKAKIIEQTHQQIADLLQADYEASERVTFGTYDADKQILPLEIDFPPKKHFQLKVSPPEARYILTQRASATASGQFWLEEDGNVVLIGALTIKVGAKKYQTAPSQDKIRIARIWKLPHDSVPLEDRKIIDVSPDGKCFATVSVQGRFHLYEGDITVALWSFESLQRVRTFTVNGGLQWLGFSPDSKLLVLSFDEAGNDKTLIFDVYANTSDSFLLHHIKGEAVRFLSDRTLLFKEHDFANVDRFYTLDLNTGQWKDLGLRRKDEPMESHKGVVFSPDKKLIARGRELFDSNGQHLRTLDYSPEGFSSDGKRLLATKLDKVQGVGIFKVLFYHLYVLEISLAPSSTTGDAAGRK